MQVCMYAPMKVSKYACVCMARVRSTSWWDVYQSVDVNEAVQLFNSKVNTILDEMAPNKTFQTSLKYFPWLSENSKLLIRERNKAQQILSENKN